MSQTIDSATARRMAEAGAIQSVAIIKRPGRPDSAERLKRAHEAAAYDAWFRAQVDASIKEADDPATRWISNEEAEASMEKLLTRLEADGKGRGAH